MPFCIFLPCFSLHLKRQQIFACTPSITVVQPLQSTTSLWVILHRQKQGLCSHGSPCLMILLYLTLQCTCMQASEGLPSGPEPPAQPADAGSSHPMHLPMHVVEHQLWPCLGSCSKGQLRACCKGLHFMVDNLGRHELHTLFCHAVLEPSKHSPDCPKLQAKKVHSASSAAAAAAAAMTGGTPSSSIPSGSSNPPDPAEPTAYIPDAATASAMLQSSAAGRYQTLEVLICSSCSNRSDERSWNDRGLKRQLRKLFPAAMQHGTTHLRMRYDAEAAAEASHVAMIPTTWGLQELDLHAASLWAFGAGLRQTQVAGCTWMPSSQAATIGVMRCAVCPQPCTRCACTWMMTPRS